MHVINQYIPLPQQSVGLRWDSVLWFICSAEIFDQCMSGYGDVGSVTEHPVQV